MTEPYNILILCTGNSARSILGEAAFNLLGEGQLCAYSAGSQPTGQPNPFAIALLNSKGIDTAFARSKSWDEFALPDAPKMDFVFTVCASAAAEECPYWPGAPMSAHWGLPDPAAVSGSQAEMALAFAQCWTSLERRVNAFLSLPIASLDTVSLRARLKSIGDA
jgi:protein-tyrosine-phosphatase